MKGAQRENDLGGVEDHQRVAAYGLVVAERSLVIVGYDR